MRPESGRLVPGRYRSPANPVCALTQRNCRERDRARCRRFVPDARLHHVRCEMLAEIPLEQMIDALRCADNGSIGVVRLTNRTAGEGDLNHLQLLSRSDDGSWSMSSSAQETAAGCEGHDFCETFGVARDLSEVPLPLPSPGVAAQVVPSGLDGGTPLPPWDITDQYADWTPVASADELRQLVLADLPSEDGTVQTSMLPERAGPIIVTTTHEDDSARRSCFPLPFGRERAQTC